MAHSPKRKSKQASPAAPTFDVSEAANDNCPISEAPPGKMLVDAALVWLATFILGGTALAAGIKIVAHLFHEPAFAELKNMGFTMAGVLGIGLAAALVIGAFKGAYR